MKKLIQVKMVYGFLAICLLGNFNLCAATLDEQATDIAGQLEGVKERIDEANLARKVSADGTLIKDSQGNFVKNMDKKGLEAFLSKDKAAREYLQKVESIQSKVSGADKITLRSLLETKVNENLLAHYDNTARYLKPVAAAKRFATDEEKIQSADVNKKNNSKVKAAVDKLLLERNKKSETPTNRRKKASGSDTSSNASDASDISGTSTESMRSKRSLTEGHQAAPLHKGPARRIIKQ